MSKPNRTTPPSVTYDVAIVGGGPAGLTAALWLARYLRRVVVVDSGDPRNWETRAVNGFLGLPGIRPAELRATGRDECRKYGVELVDGEVSRVEKEGDETFVLRYDPIEETKAEANRRGSGRLRPAEDNTLTEDTRTVTARRLLLAFGLKDTWPRVPGLRQAYGDTAHVCPDCDGYETRGKRVLVIASGRKAAGLALAISNWTPTVAVATNGEPAAMDEELCDKLAGADIAVIENPITCLVHEGSKVRAVQFDDGRELPCDDVFFAIAQRPADDLAAQLGCDRDDDGHVVVDGHYHTSVYNVFAAGDIVPGPQLAIAAAGDGAIAALSIHRSLLPASRKLEKRGVTPPAGQAAAAGVDDTAATPAGAA